VGNELRKLGFEVFDDWFAAGPEADDKWRDYEKARGRTYVVLFLPAGKSGHIELGYAIGKGKRGYIVLDNPERWDVMYKFADGVFETLEELKGALLKLRESE